MARLITTQAEKNAASYLDWDDASIGRFCKKLALIMQNQRKQKFEEGKRNDDLSACINAADGMLLIGNMIDCRAGTLTLKFGDFTHNSEPAGDWELRIRQTAKAKP